MEGARSGEAPGLSPAAIGGIIVLAVVVWLVRVPGLSVLGWFATLAHESGHAIAVELVGGDVDSVTINRYGGGVTLWHGPADLASWRRLVVASAGYLSAVAAGAALLVVAARARDTRTVLLSLAGAVALVAVLWVPWSGPDVDAATALATGSSGSDGRFTLLFCFVTVVVLVALVRAPRTVGQGVAVFLASLCLLSALDSLRELVGISTRGIHSDASTAADVTPLPEWLWAFVWAALALAIAWFAGRSIAAGWGERELEPGA
jgi:hypothetical protein